MSYLDGNGLATLWAKIKQYVIDNATSSIPDLSVTTAKIANLAVTTGKIANNAVDMGKLGVDVTNILNKIKITTSTVNSGGGRTTVAFPVSSIHLLLCCARSEYANAYCGIYFIACTNGSVIGVGEVKESNISYTTSGNRVIFTNNNSAQQVLYMITLNGGTPTIV